MKNFKPFGLDYEIELNENQVVKIEEVTFFRQYNGVTVADVYNFLDMDPNDDALMDLFENEISGDELDLIYDDLKDLSYKGKRIMLDNDDDIRFDYENKLVDESDVSEGFAFDFIFEMQSEDDEFRERYLNFLTKLLEEQNNLSSKVSDCLTEIVKNVKDPLNDRIVVIIYKVSLIDS
jgi:hypothetical protein